MICPVAKAIKDLRKTRIETIYHPQTVGFLGHDEEIERREVGPSEAEKEAIRLLEGITRYLCHDIGCVANDLDYLDDSPCTCGLRRFYNPKGVDPSRAALSEAQEGRK